jgi:hypothetical protein
MKNTKLLPFERNRYYTGKMLTSSDFLTEQNYINNKRRFINNIMFGSGIICGMSVKCLDDVSIMVDSGAAIDEFGREIVISEGCVKKLSAMEGFESVKSDQCRLYVQYDEKDIQPVYSASKKDKNDEYEYNRIHENFRLYLVDENDVNDVEVSGSDFLSTGILFENRDYRVTMTVPSVMCIGSNVKIRLAVHKLSDSDSSLSYSGVLQFPSCSVENGGHEKSVSLEGVKLGRNECVTKDVWVHADNMGDGRTSVMVKAASVECQVDNIPVMVEKDVVLSVRGERTEPRRLVDSEIGRINYEVKSRMARNEGVCLAAIKVIRNANSYEIETVDGSAVRHYIEAPATEQERNSYLDYFRDDDEGEPKASQQVVESSANSTISAEASRVYRTTGIVEIPIGRVVKKGEILYSEEVVHGLGKGNVCVVLGSPVNDSPRLADKQPEATIIGTEGIFDDRCDGAAFESAVKLYNDKGSFVVGVKSRYSAEYVVLKYRWYAMSFDKTYKANEASRLQDKRITAETPTVILNPGESYYFNVRFNNMEPTQLRYELTTGSRGSVSIDGVYTAPDKEGVYEVRIYCLNDPSICTYAYAIVKRNDGL